MAAVNPITQSVNATNKGHSQLPTFALASLMIQPFPSYYPVYCKPNDTRRLHDLVPPWVRISKIAVGEGHEQEAEVFRTTWRCKAMGMVVPKTMRALTSPAALKPQFNNPTIRSHTRRSSNQCGPPTEETSGTTSVPSPEYGPGQAPDIRWKRRIQWRKRLKY